MFFFFVVVRGQFCKIKISGVSTGWVKRCQCKSVSYKRRDLSFPAYLGDMCSDRTLENRPVRAFARPFPCLIRIRRLVSLKKCSRDVR